MPLAAQNIHRRAQEFSEELFVETEGAEQQTRSKRFAHNGKKFSNMNTIPNSTFKWYEKLGFSCHNIYMAFDFSCTTKRNCIFSTLPRYTDT